MRGNGQPVQYDPNPPGGGEGARQGIESRNGGGRHTPCAGEDLS